MNCCSPQKVFHEPNKWFGPFFFSRTDKKPSKLDFPILKSYLEHYYYKQLHSDQVLTSDTKMIFNTGLVDDYRIQCDRKHIDNIELNWEHIYRDNLIPERRRQKRLPERYYEMSETEFSASLQAAIEQSKVLILRNYKLLVPQYWKKTDDIQFIMPLFLERDHEKHPICTTALVLRRMGDAKSDNVWYKTFYVKLEDK